MASRITGSNLARGALPSIVNSVIDTSGSITEEASVGNPSLSFVPPSCLLSSTKESEPSSSERATVLHPSGSPVRLNCAPGRHLFVSPCATTHLIIEAIKRQCRISVKFALNGITYYGVSQAQIKRTGGAVWDSAKKLASHLTCVL
jgi:hypothetical protein